MNQFSFWLYPLLFVGVVSLVRHMRLPKDWGFPFVVQAAILLAVVSCALVMSNWFFVLTSWMFFILFFIVPKIAFSRMQNYIATLSTGKAIFYAGWLRLLFWGKPGRFWYDLAKAIELYVGGKEESASSILIRWQQPSTPPSFRDYVNNYRLMGLTVMWRWHEIIAEFEELKARRSKVSASLLISVSRAYAEIGRLQAAAFCLMESNLPECRLGVKAIAQLLMPFFCLAGARTELNKLFALFNRSKQDLPEYVRLYWLGRCLAVKGEAAEAREAFVQALAQLKLHPLSGSTTYAWQQRINAQISCLSPQTATSVDQKPSKPDFRNEINQVWNIFQRAIFVQNIVSPRGNSKPIGLLVLAIIVTYLVTNPYSYLKNDFTLELSLRSLQNGALIPHLALEGQYWRLVTYLFLHQHISHCLLNAIGLYWFGRIAESIYGPSRFFAIFFVSGIISGVTHTVLAPNMVAVGASGAVMGVFGAVAVAIFRMKDILPESIRKTELLWMVMLMIAQIILDRLIPHVAAFAHLGGLMAGMTAALILPVPCSQLLSRSGCDSPRGLSPGATDEPPAQS